ncbi:hypothetical protein JCM3770_007270 [Rhodotorula araucariae]
MLFATHLSLLAVLGLQAVVAVPRRTEVDLEGSARKNDARARQRDDTAVGRTLAKRARVPFAQVQSSVSSSKAAAPTTATSSSYRYLDVRRRPFHAPADQHADYNAVGDNSQPDIDDHPAGADSHNGDNHQFKDGNNYNNDNYNDDNCDDDYDVQHDDYHDYTGGATTIKGTGTLPKPTTFVTRASGSQQLTLNGAAYRIAGPNIYWLCQDENVAPKGYYTDKGRVREALAIAVAMGANTVRLISCGVSVGSNNPYSLEPSSGVWPDVAWDIHDYVIYAAREYGLRVILPLSDNYDYYHGGKYDFLRFTGVSNANKGAAFFTNQKAIDAYKAYIVKLLSHRNVYSGVTWANDPTILAWETGNEWGSYMNSEAWPSAAWTQQIVSAIKSVDSKHLIIDGTNGVWNYTTGATPAGLGVAGIDIMTDHGYPRKTDILSKEISIAKNAKKAFLIGEFDWTSSHGGVALGDYLSMIDSNGLGSMAWNVMGHDAQCCNWVGHSDGVLLYLPPLYYPNGVSSADQTNVLALVRHWYKLTGRVQPSALPGVACPQPLF